MCVSVCLCLCGFVFLCVFVSLNLCACACLTVSTSEKDEVITFNVFSSYIKTFTTWEISFMGSINILDNDQHKKFANKIAIKNSGIAF